MDSDYLTVFPIDRGPVDFSYGYTEPVETALRASFNTCPYGCKSRLVWTGQHSQVAYPTWLRVERALVLGLCERRRECYLRRPSWGTLYRQPSLQPKPTDISTCRNIQRVT